jgi:serine/threonine-protein kinase
MIQSSALELVNVSSSLPQSAALAPPPDNLPLQPGQVLAARYRIVRLIGIGGMGCVFEARALPSEDRVAIKCLLRTLMHDTDYVARFLREARATAAVRSDHVVRVFDVGQEPGGAPYFVMEYLEGEDLGQVLETRGPLSPPAAISAILQACAGVAAAHAAGVVHRDLKPSNLIATKDGLKVVDFGISKAAQNGYGGAKMTETSAVFGSPAYMSPEQVRSAKNVDARTDVWSLGVVLHELLTGQVPFDGENNGAVLAAIVADEPVSLATRAPHLPPLLVQVVHGCLVKERSRRIQSVAELAQRLAPLAGAQAALIERVRLSAPPDDSARALASARTAPELSPVRANAHRVPLLILGAVTALCVAALAFAVIVVPSPRQGAKGGASAAQPRDVRPHAPEEPSAALPTGVPLNLPQAATPPATASVGGVSAVATSRTWQGNSGGPAAASHAAKVAASGSATAPSPAPSAPPSQAPSAPVPGLPDGASNSRR